MQLFECGLCNLQSKPRHVSGRRVRMRFETSLMFHQGLQERADYPLVHLAEVAFLARVRFDVEDLGVSRSSASPNGDSQLFFAFRHGSAHPHGEVQRFSTIQTVD
jgi:hypothetical protein